ncbi:MAG: hypothetical protein V4687_12425 [Bacteroidota bacterium]
MRKLSILLMLAVSLVSCDKEKDPTDCQQMTCDASFSMLGISFTDKDGKGVAVKDYSAINLRTGEEIKPAIVASLNLVPGYYVVIDDSYRKKVSATGDDIKVTGTYEATGQTKTATLKVAGGECACHVTKISGPDKVAFD